MLKKLFCSQIAVGDIAPLFSLPDQNGVLVHLSGLIAKGWVVVYFYPKDNTKHCIVESSEFRDLYQVFRDAGADVVGISSDSSESHAQFANQYRLPFKLLSDHKAKVRKLYGVPKTFGVIPGRVTFVIDPKGVVRHTFSSQFDPRSHVKQSLDILKGSQ